MLFDVTSITKTILSGSDVKAYRKKKKKWSFPIGAKKRSEYSSPQEGTSDDKLLNQR